MPDSEFQPLSLTCPACRNRFESRLVVGFQIRDKDSDFCPRYTGGNPMPSFLHVCPDCGFVGYEADYRNLTDEEHIKRVQNLLAGFHWRPGQELSGAERFRRAALIATYIGKRSAEVADLYLQATWCSRMEGEPDDEQRNARRKAVKYFKLGMDAEEFSPDDLPLVHYLLGELYRRLGNHDSAREHFGRMDDFENVDDWLKDWRNKQITLLEP